MALSDIKKAAILGAGKMGITMIHALKEGGGIDPSRMIATGRRAEVLEAIERREGVETTLDNRAAAAESELILLCVKPQKVEEILAQISPVLTERQVVVSIAAGATLEFLQSHVPNRIPVIRAMPNTPSLIGAGMTALCAGAWATADHVGLARDVFDCMGRTVVLEEKHFDAVTGLSASGPAFIYIIIEALAEGGVKVGLPRSVATELAAQTCFGAARMVLETGEHPALLKDDVTTPAGCTMDGILTLEEGGLRVTLIKAIVEASRRAGELVEGRTVNRRG